MYYVPDHAETSFVSATDADLAWFEGLVSHPLPEGYRAFLLQNNGLFIRGGARVEASPRPFMITLCYGISREDERGNILSELFAYAFNKRVPANYLPIADCQSFERVVICVAGENTGKVYYWRPPDAWEAEEVITEEHLYHVADSFSEFWERITWDIEEF